MFAATGLPAPNATESKGYGIPPLMAMFARRSRLIATAFFGLLLIMVGATLLTPRTYTTDVQVIAGNPGGQSPVDSNAPVSSLPIVNALLLARGTQTPETYAALFQQTPVAQAVIDQLHLKTSPGALLSHISVVPITNTSLLTLSATWADPVTSASIANTFAGAVSDRERQLISDQATSAIAFLMQEMPVIKEQVQQTGSALAKYQSSHHMADMTSQTNSLLATLSTIESQQNENALSAREAAAQLKATQKQLASTPPTITGSAAIAQTQAAQTMQAQLATVEVQLQDDLHKYTDQHPVVIALREQAADLQKAIAAQGGPGVVNSTVVPNPLYQQLQQQGSIERTALQSAKAAAAELARQRKALAPALANLPQEAAYYGELQRAAQSAQAVYAAIEQKYNEAQIARTTAVSDVTITQPATAQAATIKPDIRLNLLIALIISFVVALALATLVEMFDRRLKDGAHAEQVLGLPVLSQIPLVVGQGGGFEELRSATVKSFLRLASSLQFAPKRVCAIAITSNDRGEGRSTVALNLALALAELGERVLLVDANRNVREASSGSRDSKAGLYDILLGRCNVADVVRPSRSPLVDLLPPGDRTSNVISAVGGEALREVIEDARRSYEYVVIDTPPLHDNVEASLLLRSVESAILVVKQGETDIGQARETIESIRAMGISTFVGAIVNGAEIELRDYGTGSADVEKLRLAASN